jgi:hypothetical protein
VVVINLGYEFQGTGRPLKDFHFVSRLFTGNATDDPMRQTDSRFRDSWLGQLPVPLPAHYVLGIDQQRQHCEGGVFHSYLAGQWREHGWWYYYLHALAVKVPLGVWGLVLWGLILTLTGHPSSARWVDELTRWLPAGIIFAFVSSQTGFSHHMRYVLPFCPFVLIATSKLAYFLHPARWKAGLLVAVLFLWALASSLAIHPHYLSYFNELAGGPDNGHEHLLDSNIDWGQDLLYLKDWLDQHPDVRPLGLAYYNMIDPRIVGIDYHLPPFGPSRHSPVDAAEAERLGPQPGYHAVSVNYVRGSTLVAAPNGKGKRVVIPSDPVDFAQVAVHAAGPTGMAYPRCPCAGSAVKSTRQRQGDDFPAGGRPIARQ